MCSQLNRPTSFATSSNSELNGFIDANQLPSVYSASLTAPTSDKEASDRSPRKDGPPTISFKPKDTSSATSATANSKPAVSISATKAATSAKSVDASAANRNLSFDKEIESLKSRRVSLCVPGVAEREARSLETRRASSPFENGGKELLIGPYDEHRLKTTAIIEESRRSQCNITNR